MAATTRPTEPDKTWSHYAARRSAPATSPFREREWKWLEEHGRDCLGCWLAIHGDQLIAADPDPRIVIASAEQALGEETYLLFRQPGSAPPK